MTQIFLSYRRDDSAGFAGRLSEALEAALGGNSVFRDVEDIHPGDDFVQAIERALSTVDTVLVMIGPDWLQADSAGERRLDGPADFVRLEVLAALKSGKPVMPVLVGGAQMPRGQDVPEPLRPLLRRQAFSLSDAGWKSDVARLVDTIRPLVQSTDRRLIGSPVRMALVGLALLSSLAGVWWFSSATYTATRAVVEQGVPAPDVAGHWTAQVQYDWGAVHAETFDFQLRNGRILGSASFLGGMLGIESGRLDGQVLSFVTRSDEVQGDAPARQVTHRYEGTVTADAIRFTLEITGGYSSHVPVEFVARRVAR